MEERDVAFVKAAAEIAKQVEANRDLAGDDSALQFVSRAEKESKVLAHLKQEGRDLVIGIIGCVKAGKSSFLNALIFDGVQVLPKAATPMTAALTRIRYSDKPEAKVVFYRPTDWTNIRSKNDQYKRQVDAEYQRRCAECTSRNDSISGKMFGRGAAPEVKRTLPTWEEVEKSISVSDDLRSSHELIKMAEDRNLNVEEYLGKEEYINLSGELDYQKKLNEYVGAEGRFTPIVNYIELAIDDSRLNGIEIVDTPGLNDPIVSRERKTVQFLEDCDVVFVASSVSQFLPEEDIHLLQKKLDQNNIHRAFIIGTQLDSGVLQYPKKEAPLNDAIGGSIAQYKWQAKETIGKLNNPFAPSIIQRLADSEPIFVSAMMYNIGRKLCNKIPPDKDEKFVLGQLKKQFADFSSVMESSDDYLLFSNIQEVKDVFADVQKDKDAAIRERVKEFSRNQSAELVRLLEIVNTSVRTRLSTLESADAEMLEHKLSQLSSKLDTIRSDISNLFQRQKVECDRVIQDTKVEISKDINNHQDFSVVTDKEHVEDSVSTGLFGLWKKHIEYDKHIKKASSAQVINNLQQYSAAAQELINYNLQKMFDIDGLKQRIKECVIGAFDLASREFNENEILLPLEVMLAALSVKEVRFDFLEKVEASVDAAFPDGMAKGDDIHRLYVLQSKLANDVLQELSHQMDQQNESIKTAMNLQSGTFVDTIERKIAGNIETLKAQLKNKQESIARYKEYIDNISNYKQQLLGFQG